MRSQILAGMDVPDNRHPDVPCDVCGISMRVPGYGEHFGVLQVHWDTARDMTVSVIAYGCVKPASS